MRRIRSGLDLPKALHVRGFSNRRAARVERKPVRFLAACVMSTFGLRQAPSGAGKKTAASIEMYSLTGCRPHQTKLERCRRVDPDHFRYRRTRIAVIMLQARQEEKRVTTVKVMCDARDREQQLATHHVADFLPLMLSRT